jgi:hypothetical protein
VFSRVRESGYGRAAGSHLNSDEAEYFAELQRVSKNRNFKNFAVQREVEEDAKKRETFSMLFRLFGYMLKEWVFYSIAFSFLLLYSLCKIKSFFIYT